MALGLLLQTGTLTSILIGPGIATSLWKREGGGGRGREGCCSPRREAGPLAPGGRMLERDTPARGCPPARAPRLLEYVPEPVYSSCACECQRMI